MAPVLQPLAFASSPASGFTSASRLPATLLYFLFFGSGLGGLIYQVVWVREFGNVFGNTIYSASLVAAVFMEARTIIAPQS
jgi:hypothetical protein